MVDSLNQNSSEAPSNREDFFPDTRWSLVQIANQQTGEASERALAELFQLYWYPVYCFVRRRGLNKEDAEDVTQGFFASLLQRNSLNRVNQDNGKLRAYLLSAVKNFLADYWDHKNAAKRGGGKHLFSLDYGEAEDRYHLESKEDESPDHLFEVSWAYRLLEEVIEQLRKQYESSGKTELFEALEPHLMDPENALPYRDLARQFNTTAVALRIHSHRMRNKFREILENEIAATVTSPEEIQEEKNHLMKLIRSQ